MITYEWFEGAGELAQVHYLRQLVFIDEQAVPVDRERIAAEDEASLHLLVCADKLPAATGRIFMGGGGFVLQRIAVLKGNRGQGLGKLITRMLADKCFEMGAKEVSLSSQVQARGFYEQLGFEGYGQEYMDAGIAHISMRLRKQ